MAIQWNIADAVEKNGLNECLHSIDSCFALKGKSVSSDPRSVVSFHSVSGHEFYVKRYTASGKYLRKYLGRSRVRAEWENLQLFSALGIATLDILAYGEEYRAGKFLRGALVTAGLRDASDLENLAENKNPLLFNRDSFRYLAEQIAQYTRAMHQSRFAHNDLDWRNILVAPSAAEGGVQNSLVYFFDCPGGRRWCWPFLEYRIVKDLAHLDKIARHCLPLRWRLWFYHKYTGRAVLTAQDKRRLRKIFSYYEKNAED